MNGFLRRLSVALMPAIGACGEQASSTNDVATNTETIDHNPRPSSEDDDESTNGTSSASTTTTGSSTSVSSDSETTAATSGGGETSSSLHAVNALGAHCERSERLGELGINLSADRTIIAGSVSNGVLPSSVPEVAAASGSCELLVPRDLFCSSCESSQACAGDDQCVPKPVKVSAGVLTVSGLVVPAEVAPNGITLDYSKTILEPFPAFGPGDAIGLRAAGDVTPAFDAELVGVPALSVEQDEIPVKRGEPALFSWDASAVDADTTSVFISFSVNVHGAVTGWIECNAPDTGEFEIPAELVTALIDLGLSGFPRADIERRSSATVDLGSGCVELFVGSKITKDIALEGLASCHDDTDCDSGQTCNDEMVCE